MRALALVNARPTIIGWHLPAPCHYGERADSNQKPRIKTVCAIRMAAYRPLQLYPRQSNSQRPRKAGAYIMKQEVLQLGQASYVRLATMLQSPQNWHLRRTARTGLDVESPLLLESTKTSLSRFACSTTIHRVSCQPRFLLQNHGFRKSNQRCGKQLLALLVVNIDVPMGTACASHSVTILRNAHAMKNTRVALETTSRHILSVFSSTHCGGIPPQSLASDRLCSF